MINMVMLVGRLVKDPEIIERDNGNKVSRVTLAVNRRFKGSDGVYHTDFIDCVLWDNVAATTVQYCNKGDIIGVRGRIQTRTVQKEETKNSILEVIAEKITFLTSKDNKEEKAD